jgi:hypothetical protein
MTDILPNLYVGSDKDYEKIGDRTDFRTCRCCKYGPGGHQQSLGYKTLGAPKGPDYLSVVKKNRIALNFIDVADPHLIPVEMVMTGLKYINSQLRSGHKVLIACNAGHSRGPTTGLLYLRATGELPGNFVHSERIYRTLYPEYSPGIGARQFAKQNWDTFKDALKG